MAKDTSKIFYGPAEIALYDSTNGYLWCGYAPEVNVDSRNMAHTILDGNKRQYGLRYMLDAILQQSDQALIDELVTRRSTRQTIYVVGLNNMCVLSNMFLSHSPVRDSDGLHELELEASTEVESDVTLKQNLIGADGKFETDGGSGVATNWTTTGTSTSIDTSHVSGGGNEQRVTITTSQYLRYDVVAPFESPRRISVAAEMDNRGGTAANFTIGFDLLDSAGAVISSHVASKSLASLTNGRQTHTAFVNPSEPVAKLRFRIQNTSGTGILGVDNAQMQFGRLTDFADN